MVAYNFQQQFAGLVEAGEKRQTVRPKGRRRHAFPGEAIQLYTGQRTKNCRKLRDPDPYCVFRAGVVIDHAGITLGSGYKINDPEGFARADGFASFADMLAFLEKNYGLPFTGTLIKWSERADTEGGMYV